LKRPNYKIQNRREGLEFIIKIIGEVETKIDFIKNDFFGRQTNLIGVYSGPLQRSRPFRRWSNDHKQSKPIH
jgi:hypothetical protein